MKALLATDAKDKEWTDAVTVGGAGRTRGGCEGATGGGQGGGGHRR